MSYRSIRAVDQVQTITQLLQTNIPLQHKILDCARFIKEYPQGFHEKWLLRADKISLGTRRDRKGTTEDLWEPVQGRNLEDVIDEFIFDAEDDTDQVNILFSQNWERFNKSRERQILPINREDWLKDQRAKTDKKRIVTPLGTTRRVPPKA
jgi:hypothetical protein